MRFIPLEGQMDAVEVDDEDFDFLSRLGPWRQSRDGYVYRGSKAEGNIRKMHLLVADRMGLRRTGQAVDHINYDKKDMKRSNLQLLSLGESARKRRNVDTEPRKGKPRGPISRWTL